MASMATVTINIPIPPSANHIHAFARGRVRRSKNYQTWLTTCQFMLGKPGRVSGVVGVRVVIIGGKGWRSNRDLDNTLKPILDLLRYLDIIEEDNTGIVRRIEVTFQTPATKKSDASVTVIVESMS